MENPERLNQIAQLLHKPLANYLKAKEVCERYERGRHTALAAIIVRLRKDPTSPKGIEALKTLAYGDNAFVKYMAEWDNAEKIKTGWQIEKENLENEFKALQSYFATKREELKSLHSV